MFPSELVLTATTAFVFCLPPELLIMIAVCLGRSSLLSALLVSRSWNETLRHVIWYVVKELDWHHPSHPIHRTPLPEMAPFFVQTREVSWHSNRALALTYASSSTEQLLMPQIPRAGLTIVFTLMHNLASIELHLDFLPAASDLALLPRIRNVHLNLVNIHVPPAHVHVFPVIFFSELFSRIATFKLVLPDRTQDLHTEDIVVATLWTITDLDVEPESISLASRCQGLREVTISSDRDFSAVSLRPLLRCARLETLRVNVSLGSFTDHIDVVPQLGQLTFLDVVIGFPSDIEFLRSDGPGLDLALPLLETIKFRHMQCRDHADNMSLDKVYGSILRHRANLRMFSVVGDDVDPYWVFGGLSQEDDGQGWLCRDLESLEVTLSWPDSSVRGPEQMSREWDTVLRQIGKLSQLRHLSVKSQDMQLYPASAFLEECGGLCELRTLVLSAPDTNHAWRVSQIESLLHYCPWLVNLDLGGLTLDSAETVQQWLDNKCEREIDFSFFCEEEEEEEEDGDGDESEAEYEECEEYEDDEEY